ncbi:MAG TPA: hypothetical protein VK989_16180 [Polyangia bacterium]|nr:hypothetical protein [Polyangia bacterium]
MTRSTAIVGSLALATLVGAAVFLRPRPAAKEELARPAAIPPSMLAVLKTKMGQHDLQMRELMTRVVLLDDDGIARAAGAIFDEPALARPILGDELNALFPEPFFALQDDLRNRARLLVVASSHHDRAAVADEFAALLKTCIACHDVYLGGADVAATRAGGSR